MSMFIRICCGVASLAVLAGTAVLALRLLAMDYDASVFLAGYMVIGCVLVAAYLLFYAFTGEWRPVRYRGRRKT